MKKSYSFSNKKAISIAWGKLGLIILMTIVILISFNFINKSSSQTVDSINSVSLMSKKQDCEFDFGSCNFKNCDNIAVICDEKEQTEWKQWLTYYQSCEGKTDTEKEKLNCYDSITNQIKKVVEGNKNTPDSISIEQQKLIEEYNKLNPNIQVTSAGLKIIDYRKVFASKLEPEFFDKVEKITQNLNTKPDYLMAAMNFETGGTFDPCIKNPYNGATGLIQFTDIAIKDMNQRYSLSLTKDKLCKMDRIEQLDYVEKYLLPYKGKLNTLNDVYMAIFLPSGIGKDPTYILSKQGDKYYEGNKGLDLNKDGYIVVAEASEKVVSNYNILIG